MSLTYLPIQQADLPDLNKTVPQLIFGVLAIMAGVMALWLPETLFSPMPQTVEQAEAWKEDYGFFCCKRPQPVQNCATSENTDLIDNADNTDKNFSDDERKESTV